MKFRAIPSDFTWLKQSKVARLVLELNIGNGKLLPEVVEWLETNQCIRVTIKGKKETVSFWGAMNRYKQMFDKGLGFLIDIPNAKDVAFQLQNLVDDPEFVEVVIEKEKIPYGFEKYFGADRKGITTRKPGWSSSKRTKSNQ